MMRPQRPRTRVIAVLACVALAAACSKLDRKAAPTASESEPAPAPTASAAPQTADTPAAPPPATATTPPVAPVEEPNQGPLAQPAPNVPSKPRLSPPKSLPTPAPKPARPDDDGLHSTPGPSLGVKKVAVAANNHFTCTSTEKRDNVASISEPRGARISIVGQGPCPGEVHDWSAQVSERRVEVHGTHGTASKCKCSGTGELVLRGLEPGTYDINVNGGFDRPIATRVVVSQ